MSTKQNNFWIEDISQLFSFNKGIFPNSSLTLVENMNTTARLALIACLIIALFKPVLAISTFVIATIITITIFYGLSAKEGFNGEPNLVPNLPKWYSKPTATAGASPESYTSGLAGDLFTATPNFKPLNASEFCTNKKRIPDDPTDYVSENQLLVGGPNPKTLIPVMNVMKNKSHDLSKWKRSDLTTHSGINGSNPAFDVYSSGYVKRKCTVCFKESCTCMQYEAAKNTLYKKNKFIAELPDIEFNLNPTDSRFSGYGSIDDLPDIEFITPNTTDIVDPRFSGYGPTDRCYRDEITGQTKYFYDDINSVKMPPYISRNNIDIYPWAPKYGSGFDGSSTNTILSAESVKNASMYKGLDNIKNHALDAFRWSTVKARKDLQERLMRKRNGEMWQLRTAPIY